MALLAISQGREDDIPNDLLRFAAFSVLSARAIDNVVRLNSNASDTHPTLSGAEIPSDFQFLVAENARVVTHQLEESVEYEVAKAKKNADSPQAKLVGIVERGQNQQASSILIRGANTEIVLTHGILSALPKAFEDSEVQTSLSARSVVAATRNSFPRINVPVSRNSPEDARHFLYNAVRFIDIQEFHKPVPIGLVADKFELIDSPQGYSLSPKDGVILDSPRTSLGCPTRVASSVVAPYLNREPFYQNALSGLFNTELGMIAQML